MPHQRKLLTACIHPRLNYAAFVAVAEEIRRGGLARNGFQKKTINSENYDGERIRRRVPCELDKNVSCKHVRSTRQLPRQQRTCLSMGVVRPNRGRVAELLALPSCSAARFVALLGNASWGRQMGPSSVVVARRFKDNTASWTDCVEAGERSSSRWERAPARAQGAGGGCDAI